MPPGVTPCSASFSAEKLLPSPSKSPGAVSDRFGHADVVVGRGEVGQRVAGALDAVADARAGAVAAAVGDRARVKVRSRKPGRVSGTRIWNSRSADWPGLNDPWQVRSSGWTVQPSAR